MPQVRCPRCGTTNDTRAPGYPFCVGCQDNLARCGHCQWFDDNALVCTHPVVAGVFEVSREATPPCGYHTVRETLRVRRGVLQVLVWIGLAAAIFALAYGVLGALRPPPAARPQAKMTLAVEADYRGAVVGEPYRVEVIVHNTSDVVATNVRFEIELESLEALYLREVTPEPTARGESERWRVLKYPELNPLERRRIALHLVPRKAGALHLKVRLVSGDDNYHGVAYLPIMVAESEGAGESEPGGEGEEER